MPVTMETKRLEVSNVQTAPMFSVTDAKGKIVGDIIVSSGGLYWRSKSNQQHHMVRWESVAELFEKHGEKQTVDR
ncbi:MAG: hypothetical protein ABL932_10350 [Terricaulis sp.]